MLEDSIHYTSPDRLTLVAQVAKCLPSVLWRTQLLAVVQTRLAGAFPSIDSPVIRVRWQLTDGCATWRGLSTNHILTVAGVTEHFRV